MSRYQRSFPVKYRRLERPLDEMVLDLKMAWLEFDDFMNNFETDVEKYDRRINDLRKTIDNIVKFATGGNL